MSHNKSVQWVLLSITYWEARAFRGRLSTGEKAVTPIIATHLCPQWPINGPMLDSYAPPAGRLYSLNFRTIVLSIIWSFSKLMGKLLILSKFRWTLLYMGHIIWDFKITVENLIFLERMAQMPHISNLTPDLKFLIRIFP